MDEIEAKNLIGELVEEEDIASLDVLFTLAFGEYNCKINKEGVLLIAESVGRIAEHNLGVKYEGDASWRKSKLGVARRLDEKCNFYPDDQEIELLQSILMEDAKDIFQKDIRKRMERLKSIEKDALAFITYLFDLEKEKYLNGKLFSVDKYYSPHIEKEIILPFNLLFNKKLRLSREILVPKVDELLGRKIKQKLYSYEVFDIVIKSGAAFLCPWITNYNNVHLRFVIPNFLYQILKENGELIIPNFLYKLLKRNGEDLPRIEDFKNKVEKKREELERINIQKTYPYILKQRENYYTDGEIEDYNI